ncbi:MAG TPA: hypothetical protein VGK63_10065, partial [Candidatus Limnocylindrales bacterium]
WLGWVAEAGLDGERWIEADRFECPARPRTFAAFRTLEPLVAVACETGKIRFEARLGRPEATCGADPGWTIEPEWLGSPCPHPPFFLADPYEASGDMLFDLAWSPRLDATGLNPGVEPQDFLNVYVTGRYDHAAARSCHAVSNDVPVPDLQPGEVVLRCRAMFVVTKLEPIVP